MQQFFSNLFSKNIIVIDPQDPEFIEPAIKMINDLIKKYLSSIENIIKILYIMFYLNNKFKFDDIIIFDKPYLSNIELLYTAFVSVNEFRRFVLTL